MTIEKILSSLAREAQEKNRNLQELQILRARQKLNQAEKEGTFIDPEVDSEAGQELLNLFHESGPLSIELRSTDLPNPNLSPTEKNFLKILQERGRVTPNDLGVNPRNLQVIASRVKQKMGETGEGLFYPIRGGKGYKRNT